MGQKLRAAWPAVSLYSNQMITVLQKEIKTYDNHHVAANVTMMRFGNFQPF